MGRRQPEGTEQKGMDEGAETNITVVRIFSVVRMKTICSLNTMVERGGNEGEIGNEEWISNKGHAQAR